ncbi:tetratricopeptide repeat protein [Streptomyces violaceus]|uniref:tetratricopeptide repeat protein n=1 Tax=Streptomyces violaceus TaxID=1936 RepID=UPI0031EAAF1E
MSWWPRPTSWTTPYARRSRSACPASAATGRGLSLALGALAPHLPRYQRSIANYARLLVEPQEQPRA